MSYEEAKAHQAKLEAISKAAGAILGEYPRGPMGLTPDEIKLTPKWRAERAASDRAFQAVRQFNAWFHKEFGAQYKAERKARIEAMTSANHAGSNSEGTL